MLDKCWVNESRCQQHLLSVVVHSCLSPINRVVFDDLKSQSSYNEAWKDIVNALYTHTVLIHNITSNSLVPEAIRQR